MELGCVHTLSEEPRVNVAGDKKGHTWLKERFENSISMLNPFNSGTADWHCFDRYFNRYLERS